MLRWVVLLLRREFSNTQSISWNSLNMTRWDQNLSFALPVVPGRLSVCHALSSLAFSRFYGVQLSPFSSLPLFCCLAKRLYVTALPFPLLTRLFTSNFAWALSSFFVVALFHFFSLSICLPCLCFSLRVYVIFSFSKPPFIPLSPPFQLLSLLK